MEKMFSQLNPWRCIGEKHCRTCNPDAASEYCKQFEKFCAIICKGPRVFEYIPEEIDIGEEI